MFVIFLRKICSEMFRDVHIFFDKSFIRKDDNYFEKMQSFINEI